MFLYALVNLSSLVLDAFTSCSYAACTTLTAEVITLVCFFILYGGGSVRIDVCALSIAHREIALFNDLTEVVLVRIAIRNELCGVIRARADHSSCKNAGKSGYNSLTVLHIDKGVDIDIKNIIT